MQPAAGGKVAMAVGITPPQDFDVCVHDKDGWPDLYRLWITHWAFLNVQDAAYDQDWRFRKIVKSPNAWPKAGGERQR